MVETIGQPLQIVNVDDEKKFFLEKDNLEKLLLQDEVKDLPVVVISVVGTYREGKSFLLNFFLRFLHLTCKEHKNIEDWLKPVHGPLSGFDWKNSSERQTVGIVMWSEIFISELPSGEEVAIILLDTQGIFDNQSSGQEHSKIFSLAALLSSVLIYNIKAHINQSHLMFLEFVLNYGQFLIEDNPDVTPFQKIMFLIRDWVNLDEYKFGDEGGQEYVKKQLEEDESEERTKLKNCLKKFFGNVDGFLLPDPGKNVWMKDTKNLDEMKDDFIIYIGLLVTKILHKNNLVVKEINRNKVTGKVLYDLMTKYCNNLNEETFNLDSMYQATAEVHNFSVRTLCVTFYENLMRDTINDSFSNRCLIEMHIQNRAAAVDKFRKEKMVDGDMITKCEEELMKEVEKKFEVYKMKQTLKENKRMELLEKRKVTDSKRRQLLMKLELQLHELEEKFKKEERSKDRTKANSVFSAL